MKIQHVETALYRIPLSRTLTDSRHGQMTEFEVVLVRLETSTGVRGVGYTYTIGVGGGAIQALIDDAIAPLLIGEEITRTEWLWERLWWKLHYIGRGGLVSFALSAVDIAAWDALGKQYGQPLWRLLGGFSREVIPYAGGIDLMFPLEDLLAQMRRNVDSGLTAVKMKVGRRDYREDIERVEAVRREIGPDIKLMVDANMQWSVDASVRAARAMRPFDIYWLEEPTIPDDYSGHARIEREGGIPVAAGENLHSIYEFKHMLEVGNIAFPEPDVSNCGGVTGWMRVAKLAYAHNRMVTTHGVHELHLHLLAAIPNSSYLEIHGFGLERFMKNPPVLEEGVMKAPEDPGHSVVFDWDALEAYRLAKKP